MQRLGLCLTAIGFILLIDLLFVYNHTNPYIAMLSLPLLLLSILYVLTFFYSFTVFVHYELTIGKLLKHAVLHAVVRPFLSVGMLVSLLAAYYLMFQFPGVLPFFWSFHSNLFTYVVFSFWLYT